MKRLVGALVLLLCLSFGLYGEVTLSDEQAMELEETLDELEAILQEQQTTISDLESQNNEQQKLLETQKNKISELNTLYEKQKTSSVLRLIATAISSLAVGLLIGLLL